jgi:sugar-specific transcriptional regulator TrmB
MDNYTELYAWIWKVFGKEEFSIDQFRSTFPTSQGPKVVHDLIKKGYLRRVGRAVYRTVEPKEFIENIAEREEDLELLEKAEKEYAFCNNTAVSIWTDGYYWTGFTMGFKPVSLAIRKKDIALWRKFFKKAALKYALEGERRTLYGQVFMLHPREKLIYIEKDGIRVVTLEEVVKFCLAHKLVYEPALDYLDEKYNISYGKREQMVA